MRREHYGDGEERRGGLGGFLRSLLSGIPWSERAEGAESFEVESPPTSKMVVDNSNGNTRILGEEREGIEVRVQKMARAESEEEAARLVDAIRVITREDAAGILMVEVDIPGRWNRRGRADLEILVPRDLKVKVVAANGSVCLMGLRGACRARSSNGTVRVNDVVGDVEIHTSNAKVHTACTCGRLTARSSNGKIEMQDHRGSVDAATSNGTISCEIEGMGKEGVMLVTSNGRIHLELPDDANADVDIRVDNGVIRSQRDFSEDNAERSGRLKGTLGDGGVPVRLRASNGTVSLR